MWKHLFDGFRLIHGILFAVAAVASFKFWVRTRFWFPRYIHVLAAISLGVMCLVLSTMPPDAQASKYGLISRCLFALTLPAIVYAAFIVYGGPRAAFHSRYQVTVPCPFCQTQLQALPKKSSDLHTPVQFADKACPACGHPLH
jgi:hypothetical protein